MQLRDFVKKDAPGTRLAIFGLTSRLYFLQGFTSDPLVLKDVVEHKLTAKASSLLRDPTGSNSDSTSASSFASDGGLGAGAILSNLQNFEAEQDAFKTRLRMEYTLDAFNTLGRYLAAFPGRKNIIWFSGSFPLDIVPDLTLANPFMVMGGDMEAQYRETTNLLTKAQVAVYPVDARGIMVDPSLDAAASGAGTAKHPEKFASDMSKFGDSQAQEHETMMAIASDTGGEAFFNTNDLASAVSKAIDAGSNFYTLTYSPSHRNADGEYRTIKVELSDAARAKGIKLSFRNGYFAEDSSKNGKLTQTAVVKDTAPPDGHSFSYVAAAMSRGAPTPSDLLFRVRVLPATTTTEDLLARDNKPDPKAAFKGPYRRFDIDISALPAYLSLPLQPNGHHTDKLEFLAFVYDPDGKLLNVIGEDVSLDLKPDEYKKFMDSKIGFHLELSAPAKGESFIRIGIHDIPANTFGVVEVPTSSVVHLSPPVYPANRMQTK
jgi:VWFA-related protein